MAPAALDTAARESHIRRMETGQLERLVAQAQREFGSRAMWWMRKDVDPASQWPLVVKALRLHGGHAGMALAERIVEAAHAADRPSA